MSWIIANWEYCLLGLYIVEKVVHISPAKWDDIVFDGLKTIALGLYRLFKRSP